MLDLGATGEVLFIALAILVLAKPQDLPVIMRKIGRAIFALQQAFQYYKYEWTTYCSLLDQDDLKKATQDAKTSSRIKRSSS